MASSLRWAAKLRAIPSNSLKGDKVALPQSVLVALLAQAGEQPLPYPLTFKITNPPTNTFAHCVPREFSADEEQVELSSFLWDALGLKDGVVPEVTMSTSQLEKGTFVRLRPLESSEDDIDWKHVLEQYMRNFSTLTVSQVLSVPYGGVEMRFLVDKLEPEEAVSVVDTDLEVDIEALDENQARETLKKQLAKRREKERAAGTPVNGKYAGDRQKGGVLKLGEKVEETVLPGEYVDFELKGWNRNLDVSIELENDGGDEEVDIYISTTTKHYSRPRIDIHTWRDWTSNYPKEIRIGKSNVDLEKAEGLYISVHGYEGNAQAMTPRRFILLVKQEAPDTTGTKDPPIELDDDDDMQMCPNCKQQIPKASFTPHSIFCGRNLVPCRTCKKVFHRSALPSHWHCDVPGCSVSGVHGTPALQKHKSLEHPSEPLLCKACSETTEPTLSSLALHRSTTCPARLHICRFCHLLQAIGSNSQITLSDLTPHEQECGSRTTDCIVCKRPVRLRDLDTHNKHHQLNRLALPKPIVCRNQNCPRVLANEAEGRDSLGMCKSCFAPLYASEYDPDHTLLFRRIDRRYLTQVLAGCKKFWCRNPWCKTGREQKGLPPLPSGRAGAAVVAKERSDSELEGFCVDEAADRKMRLVDEGVMRGDFAREWVSKAVEVAGKDWRQWAEINAKKRWEED